MKTCIEIHIPVNTNDPTVYCDSCSEYIEPVEPSED
jgi:hypothetical protein